MAGFQTGAGFGLPGNQQNGECFPMLPIVTGYRRNHEKNAV